MTWVARTLVAGLALLFGLSGWGSAQDGPGFSFRVVGWNMQSDFTTKRQESDPELLRQQMARKRGVHVWGLSEVLESDLKKFAQGAAEGGQSEFASVLGKTGGRDRLAVLYDTARFDLVAQQELGMIQMSSGLRAPLVAHLRSKEGRHEFLFMVNHLKRGEAQNPIRLEQARRLNQWARDQTLPVIAVGDYNFDYDVVRGDLGVPHRDGGFDALTKDNKFLWVRPEQLFKTQADRNFNTVLDFVFVANVPFGWFSESRILEREADEPAQVNEFDDDDRQSDHRPVDAVFSVAGPVDSVAARRPKEGPVAKPLTGASPVGREELLRRIDEMENQLRQLRKLVQQMDR